MARLFAIIATRIGASFLIVVVLQALPLWAADPATEPAKSVAQQEPLVKLFNALKDRHLDDSVTGEMETLLPASDNPPETLTADQKTQWTERRRDLGAQLEAAQQYVARSLEFSREAEPNEVQRRLESARKILSGGSGEAQPIAAEASLTELEQKLATKQAEVANYQEQFSQAETEIKRRTARRAEVPKLVAAANNRLQEIDKLLAQSPPADMLPELQALIRASQLAEKLSKRAELDAAQKEIQKYDAMAEVLPLERDCIAQALALREKELKQLNELVAVQRKAEAEKSARAARTALLEAAGADPRVRALAQENADLAERRKVLADKLQFRTQQIERERRIYAPVLKSFEDLREREQFTDTTDRAVVLHLQSEMLPDHAELRGKIKEVASDLAESQLAFLEYERERSTVSVIDREVEALLAVDAEPSQMLEQELKQHLESKRANLDALSQAYEKYIPKLLELRTYWETTNTQMDEFREYIAERVLWLRSAEPFSLSGLTTSAYWLHLATGMTSAVVWFSNPVDWIESGRLLWTDAEHNIALWLAGCACAAALVALRPRLRTRVRDEGKIAVRGHTDTFRPTAIAAACTAALSVVWPSIACFVAWRLFQVSSRGTHARAVGLALLLTVAVCLPLELLRQVCRPLGLAEMHFDWPRRTVSIVRRGIRRLMVLAIPLVLITVMLHSHSTGRQISTRTFAARVAAVEPTQWSDSLGRCTFLLLMLAVARFIHKLIRPGRGVLDETLSRYRGGWLDRLWWIWYPTAVGAPLALAILAAAGFYYTSLQLAWRLEATLELLLGLLLTHALLLRLLVVVRRRLAMDQARARRAAMQESREAGSDLVDPLLDSERLNLTVVSQQTRHLLQSAVICALMLGMCAVWIDVLPALKKLNEYQVWSESAITVGNLLAAGLVAMMTILAARNIPGLLEISVLQKLPLQPGSSYAITTICRYCAVVIGLIFSAWQLQIHWNQVQWLVAAISVGLGFGLQEIFGNFISGLIILFERPIRVGDVITVGTVTGSVSKIRMRATTILDGDRKELIVPNKEFITGQVVNWTLSEDTIRQTIRITVEYGTDTVLAQRLMLEAAQEHPNVLEEPAPSAYLESFREHSLEFVLCVFLPNLGFGAKTRHELLQTISDTFQSAGIQVAIPYRDLHLHTSRTSGTTTEKRRSA